MPSYSAFVINLEHDGERRRHMEDQLARLGIAAEFVPAVNGRALSCADRQAYDHVRALRVYGVDMLPTEIGCYLSHYRLFERMVREGIDVALIMEDDIEISPALPGILESLVADPAPEWLAVRLESMRGSVRNPKSRKFLGEPIRDLPGGQLYRLGTHVLGFGAYLIRREGAERMLAYGERIFMPIDQTMDRFWENRIVPYIIRPIPVRQRQEFESRIGARPPARRHEQPIGVRVQQRWQRISDGFRKRMFWIAR